MTGLYIPQFPQEIDLSNYPTKADLAGYATQSYVNDVINSKLPGSGAVVKYTHVLTLSNTAMSGSYTIAPNFSAVQAEFTYTEMSMVNPGSGTVKYGPGAYDLNNPTYLSTVSIRMWRMQGGWGTRTSVGSYDYVYAYMYLNMTWTPSTGVISYQATTDTTKLGITSFSVTGTLVLSATY